MKKHRKLFLLFTLCCCVCAASIGCGTSSTDNPTGSQTSTNSSSVDSTETSETTASSATDSERRVLADRICRTVEAIDGVQDASVLIADASEGTSSSDVTSSQNNTSSAASSSNTRDTTSENNTNTASGNGANANSNTINAAPGNANAPYTAIIGVTCTETIQSDNTKQNNIAATIQQMVLQDENSIQDVIVTMDESDLSNISNLANNMLENTSTGAVDEINRLRDDLMDAGTNLTRSARDITDGIGSGIQDLAR